MEHGDPRGGPLREFAVGIKEFGLGEPVGQRARNQVHGRAGVDIESDSVSRSDE